MPAPAHTSLSLPGEFEPDLLLHSDPTWATHGKAKMARSEMKHLKPLAVQGQAHEKGNNEERCLFRHRLQIRASRLGPR